MPLRAATASTKTLFAVLAMAFVVAACTSDDEGDNASGAQSAPASPRAATEQLISGQMADVIGLGPLAVTCPDMSEATSGEVFQCSAMTEQQTTINVAAEIMPTGQVDMSTTNVITAEAVESFEQAAVDALNTTLAEPLAYDAMECGSASIVLNSDNTTVCGLFDPATEATFDVTLTVSDLENRKFSLAVADLPRR